jgi:hypothetical protein
MNEIRIWEKKTKVKSLLNIFRFISVAFGPSDPAKPVESPQVEGLVEVSGRGCAAERVKLGLLPFSSQKNRSN